ncbi:hypothetical protein NBH81_20495 [Aeromonas veronii]|uniref:hypothetical protein n=1 Tax=Aeromonas veronii TaxID=654 RepID=UPI0021DA43B6|nr:hypothetical protein [Aeromonas veronii]UYB70665.1 hypothetical protein NBH81_20495 [Aeromonas veronii]
MSSLSCNDVVYGLLKCELVHQWCLVREDSMRSLEGSEMQVAGYMAMGAVRHIYWIARTLKMDGLAAEIGAWFADRWRLEVAEPSRKIDGSLESHWIVAKEEFIRAACDPATKNGDPEELVALGAVRVIYKLARCLGKPALTLEIGNWWHATHAHHGLGRAIA